MRRVRSTITLSQLSEVRTTTAQLFPLVRPPAPVRLRDHPGPDFWGNRQLAEVAAQIAGAQATWLLRLPAFDLLRAAFPANLRPIEDLGLAEV